jgi:serine/threonine-protein kinase
MRWMAGRGEEARPRLERVARSCSGILGGPFGTFMWARTHLYLDELDEQRGDKAAACAQFAKILDRWGHAKPRSVTADEARAHARKLGCDLAAAR